MISRQDIDALLRRATDSGRIPGVIVMVATDAGIVYEGAYGRRSLARPEAMSPDTVVWLGSMTKPITTAAAMQLVERGALSLDDPVTAACPELAQARVLTGFGAGGEPLLRPLKRPITMRHLLSHTSGLGYEMWNRDLARFQAATGTPSVLTSRKAALAMPLVADPGETFEFGIGIDWAGRVIEAVAGRSLGVHLRQELLGPLGMSDTGFRIGPTQRARLAKIHSRIEDGTLEPSDIEIPQQQESEMGGAGLYGTVGDYLRFTQMILRGGCLHGARVLREDTIRAMARSQIGAFRLRPLRTAMPPLSNDAVFWSDLPQSYGFGFHINEARTPQGRSAGSLAGAGLANCYFWIDPQRNVTGIVATQILPFFDGHALQLFRDVESAVYRAL